MIPSEYQHLRNVAIGVLALLIAGCGEGGLPYQPDGTSLVISNLVVSPTMVLHDQGGGMAQAEIRINTETVGTFTLRVWLVDETIRSSNTLDMQFTIT